MILPLIVRTIEHWPIDRLVVDRRNARLHPAGQIDRLASNIRKFGFVNPILVGSDQVIIGGHGRLAAARKLEMHEVPVIVIDHLSDGERRALALADNRLAEDASWDEELLRLELAALRDQSLDLELTGFDQKELERLLAESSTDGLRDTDTIPEVPASPTSQRGDLWCAGEHRILCGDSLAQEEVDLLLGDDRADLGFADPLPPVSRSSVQEKRGRPTSGTLPDVLFSSFKQFRRVMKGHAPLYVAHDWQRQAVFEEALERAGFTIRDQIIWVKGSSGTGGRYRSEHEPVFYCHVKGQRDQWFGGKSQSTVWQTDGPESEAQLPGTKSVEQVERAILNSSKAGDLVVDLFGGTGTTLIACERRKRRAAVIEMEPAYVDVIVRRWQQETGLAATWAGDGSTFDEQKQLRRAAAGRLEKECTHA